MDERQVAVVDKEVDRVYNSSDEVIAVAVTNSRFTGDVLSIRSSCQLVTSTGSTKNPFASDDLSAENIPTDVVFWNPWAEKVICTILSD